MVLEKLTPIEKLRQRLGWSSEAGAHRAQYLAHEVPHGAVVLVEVGGEVIDGHGGLEEGLRGRQVVVAQRHAVLQQLHHLQCQVDEVHVPDVSAF